MFAVFRSNQKESGWVRLKLKMAGTTNTTIATRLRFHFSSQKVFHIAVFQTTKHLKRKKEKKKEIKKKIISDININIYLFSVLEFRGLYVEFGFIEGTKA